MAKGARSHAGARGDAMNPPLSQPATPVAWGMTIAAPSPILRELFRTSVLIARNGYDAGNVETNRDSLFQRGCPSTVSTSAR